MTAGSTAISYAAGPPVRFTPVAVTPEPLSASHGGPYAVAIHGPPPDGNPLGVGAGAHCWVATPPRRTTGSATSMKPPAAASQRSQRCLRSFSALGLTPPALAPGTPRAIRECTAASALPSDHRG